MKAIICQEPVGLIFPIFSLLIFQITNGNDQRKIARFLNTEIRQVLLPDISNTCKSICTVCFLVKFSKFSKIHSNFHWRGEAVYYEHKFLSQWRDIFYDNKLEMILGEISP